jgi:hypothetical protein
MVKGDYESECCFELPEDRDSPGRVSVNSEGNLLLRGET